MKKIVITLALSALFWACEDYHKCEFDEQGALLKCSEGIYKVVNADGRNWFMENSFFYTDFSYCYTDDYKLCENYGRLYTWDASRKVCPLGWHVPTKHEFESLMASGEFEKLKIQKAGFRYREDSYVDRDVSARVWLGDEYDAARAYIVNVDDENTTIEHFNKDIAASVRCIED